MGKKYIDAEVLKNNIHKCEWVHDIKSVGKFVDRLPAADVVEVVRCKDCTMYKRDKELAEANYCDPNFYCGLLRTEMDKDGYCSYGRRKDE